MGSTTSNSLGCNNVTMHIEIIARTTYHVSHRRRTSWHLIIRATVYCSMLD